MADLDTDAKEWADYYNPHLRFVAERSYIAGYRAAIDAAALVAFNHGCETNCDGGESCWAVIHNRIRALTAPASPKSAPPRTAPEPPG